MEGLTEATKTLTVIGAGPKAVAIAAKHSVLRNLGVAVPELVVIDDKGLGAHWTGDYGYTNGSLPLGTPPEKDVGFPYASEGYGRDLDREIDQEMLRLSWHGFHIRDRRESLAYASWVDRGKPHPRHQHWAEYLQWVADEVKLEVRDGRLTEIDLRSSRWRLSFDSRERLETDGLVITGPGPPRLTIRIEGGRSDWVFNGASFWLRANQDRIRDLVVGNRPIECCVIGSGETAAAVVVQLVNLLPPLSTIDVISRTGVIYTRGESHDENQLYSRPESWLELPADVRAEFVRRTDRGVFSVTAKEALNSVEGVQTVAGTVSKVEVERGLRLRFEDDRESVGYSFVVDATGFRPDWFHDLMTDTASTALEAALPEEEDQGLRSHIPFLRHHPSENLPSRLAAEIDRDLAVKRLRPRLHLPILAAMQQGPGFPNLSCLGLLADRILQAYPGVTTAATAPAGQGATNDA